MTALLYICISVILGYEIVSYLVPDVRRLFLAIAPNKSVLGQVSDLLFKIPAGAIVGISLTTFVSYFLTLGLSYFLTRGQTSLIAGISVTSLISLYLILLLISKNHKRSVNMGTDNADSKLPNKDAFAFNSKISNYVFYGLSIVFFSAIASFLMFYTFRITNGTLHNGYSVFSDLAPHTAMVSSFGVGSNFPTQYMHFSGDGIQYHFLFYFFCGSLQYLGLPIDYAINVPSIIAMVCAFSLLGLLAVLLSGRKMTFFLAPLLVLFRSGLNVFMSLQSMLKFGYSLKYSLTILKNSPSWFNDTPYDSWGIWAINVYANQRHLLFGVSLILILIFLFIPYVRRMCITLMGSGTSKSNVSTNSSKSECAPNSASAFAYRIKSFFASHNSWLPRQKDPIHPIRNLFLALIIVITMPYFHGSALIAALLILFIMAIFSENRLAYLAVAVAAVISSYIQTRLFSGNYRDFVIFAFKPGFVCEDASPMGITKYLIYITGLTLVLALLYAIIWLIKDIVKHKPIYRTLLFVAFCSPLAFAFLFQVSLEMLANHKFIQITLILMDVFVATIISNLLILPIRIAHKKSDLPVLLPLDTDKLITTLESSTPPEYERHQTGARLPLLAFIPTQAVSVIVALALIVGLMGTGVAEWCTFINLNKSTLDVNTKSELTEWIERNTSPSDVFLTPMWYTNRFFLAGRPTYYGWPYYAWSAGHDTVLREEIYYWLLSGCGNNIDEFKRYCKEREIKYLIMDPEFYDMTTPAGQPAFNAEFFVENLKPVAFFASERTFVYQIY